jgi:hypothetical protein
MIDVTFQVTLPHYEDADILRLFSVNTELPALPPNVTDTEFKMVPGVANILTNLVLTWNHARKRYIISGSIEPDTAEGFERVAATLLREGWQEEQSQAEPLV